MPKLQRTEEQKKQSLLKGTIEKYRLAQNMSNAELARRICVTTPTFYRKLQYPNTLTFGDIYSICNVLKIPQSEIAKCFPGETEPIEVKVVLTNEMIERMSKGVYY